MNILEIPELTENEVLQSYLSFKLDDELFAVEVKKVIEILEVPKITVIPRAPKYMAGIINLRGKVLPLIDTRIQFGLETISFTVDTCIVVIEIEIEGEKIEIGTLVDSVLEVVDIPEDSILPCRSIEAKYKLDYIKGMFQSENDFIMLINLDKVFSIQESDFIQDK